MLPSAAYLSPLILFALTVGLADRTTGESTLGFQVVTAFNKENARNYIENDRARARALINGERPKSVDIDNRLRYYTAEIGIGNPPTNYTLVIDTASALTWVGASNPYVNTTTSRKTSYRYDASYSLVLAGSYGDLWTDTVTLAPGLSLEGQTIGVASESGGIPGDGILGLGPVDLTEDIVHIILNGVDVSVNTTVPTVMDNLLAQDKISQEVIGIYFTPNGDSGELTFGGYDESVITTPVHFAPVTKSYPASMSWSVDLSITYDTKKILPEGSAAGIVDTNVHVIYLAADGFHEYLTRTGASPDPDVGCDYSLNLAQYANLKPLIFNIGNKPFELSPNAQILPRSLTNGAICLAVAGINDLPEGIGAVVGFPFLERYYNVYDTTNKRVGFAETKYTFAETN